MRLRHFAPRNLNDMLEAEELSRLDGSRSEQEAYDNAERNPTGGMERPNEAIAFLDIHCQRICKPEGLGSDISEHAKIKLTVVRRGGSISGGSRVWRVLGQTRGE
jgi:hypothetical protein